jgi:hypothetical protein
MKYNAMTTKSTQTSNILFTEALLHRRFGDGVTLKSKTSRIHLSLSISITARAATASSISWIILMGMMVIMVETKKSLRSMSKVVAKYRIVMTLS